MWVELILDSVSTKWRLNQVDADIAPEWTESADGHVASDGDLKLMLSYMCYEP